MQPSLALSTTLLFCGTSSQRFYMVMALYMNCVLVLILALVYQVAAEAKANKACSLKPDPGPCKAFIIRWYYNPISDVCFLTKIPLSRVQKLTFSFFCFLEMWVIYLGRLSRRCSFRNKARVLCLCERQMWLGAWPWSLRSPHSEIFLESRKWGKNSASFCPTTTSTPWQNWPIFLL